jgi:hypothetical protein
MEIEICEMSEATTAGLDKFEISQESSALVESLGLTGQQTYYSPDPDPSVNTRILFPYKRMTPEEIKVYSHMYPQQESIVDYDSGPIPLRVLKLIEENRVHFPSSARNNETGWMEIWGPQVEDPDPILVALIKDPENTWTTHHYLLARWGESLRPFSDIRADVFQRIKEKWEAKAQEVIVECDAFLQNPSAKINQYLSGENIYTPYS